MLLAADQAGVARQDSDGFRDWYLDLDQDTDAEITRLFGLNSHDYVVTGDWNGDQKTDLGVVTKDGAFLRWLLDTDGDPGAEINFLFGLSTDKPVSGDWDGNGTFNAGVVRPEGPLLTWYQDFNNDPGVDQFFQFGFPTDRPVTGDWDGDGTTNVGVAREEGAFLRWYYDINNNPFHEAGDYLFGLTTHTVVTGDWDGNGITDAGTTAPEPNSNLMRWYQDTNRDPSPEDTFLFGFSTDTPVTGKWRMPEIKVSIAGGPEIFSEQTFEFGNGGAGEAPHTRNFTIRNTGNSTLTLSVPSLPSGYSTVGFPQSLAGGAAKNFSIRLNPTAAGQQQGAITFTTNDGDEELIFYNLVERASEVSVDQVSDGGTFNFGPVEVGGTLQKTFTIRNSGEAILDVSAPVLSGPFHFVSNPFPAAVPINGTVSFKIGVDTAAIGSKLGSISFSTDDPGNATYAFNLTANVRRPFVPDNVAVVRPNPGGFFQDWFFDLDQNPDAEMTRLYGIVSDVASVTGDWDNNGVTDMGIVRSEGNFLHWYLDTNGDATPDIDFLFGLTGDIPVVGDWDGNGTFNAAVVRPENGLLTWYQDFNNDPGVDQFFSFGFPTDKPVAGDWDGDGTTNVGIVREENGFLKWYYDLNNDSGHDNTPYIFGLVGDQVLTGDWDADGITDAAVTRAEGPLMRWYQDTNRDPNFEKTFLYGFPSDRPVSGNWSLSELSVRRADGLEIFHDANLWFGNDGPGEFASTQSFTVTNTGNAPLTLSNPSPPTGYTVDGFPGTLAAGQSKNFSITLNVNAAGIQSGPLSFTTNDGDEQLVVYHLSEGAPEAAVVFAGTQNEIADDVGSVNFRQVVIGTSSERSFEIVNVGQATLTLSNPVVTGDFSLTSGAFPPSISPGGRHRFTIAVNTASLGPKTGAFSVATNDSDENPYSFDLAATVVDAVAEITSDFGESGSTVPFGLAVINTASQQVVTIANEGNSPLQLGAASLSSSDFSIVGSPLPATVPAGDDLQITLRMNTSRLGDKNATLSIPTNDSDENPFRLLLAGDVGIQPVPDIKVSTTLVDFGVVNPGGSVVRTIVLGNTGSAILNVGQPTVTSGFSIVSPSFPRSIAGGSSVPVIVQMTGGSVGAQTGTLSFPSNDPDGFENPLTVNLTGQVVAPTGPNIDVPSLQNGMIDFGEVEQGSTNAARRTVTIQNVGSQSLTIHSVAASGGFTVVGGSFSATLSPNGGTRTFQLQAPTGTIGNKLGTVTINSNSPGEESFQFQVKAAVVPQIADLTGEYLFSLSSSRRLLSTSAPPINVGPSDVIRLRTFEDGSHEFSLALSGATLQLQTVNENIDALSVLGSRYYFSTTGIGQVPGHAFDEHEIVSYDVITGEFDVVEYPTSFNLADNNIDALYAIAENRFGISIEQQDLLPIAGQVDNVSPGDVVVLHTTTGNYEFRLRGRDEGLTATSYNDVTSTPGPENVDAADDFGGRLQVSTSGFASFEGGHSAQEEDVSDFVSGNFRQLVDFSRYGISGVDVDAIHVVTTDGAAAAAELSTYGDFGDAPSIYPTAIHVGNESSPVLGQLRDLEAGTQAHPDAQGDDTNVYYAGEVAQPSDEDGVTMLDPLVVGGVTDLLIEITSSDGIVDAWMDYNGDGDWDDAGEKVLDAVPVTVGLNHLSVVVPADAVVGETFMRVRVSETGSASPEAMAVGGEVEDYKVAINGPPAGAEFGDAPAPYPTAAVDNGANHVAIGPRLGANRDAEADGIASAGADGDDANDLINDEDGVHFGGIHVNAEVAAVNIVLENALSAKIDAWIDFDRDGVWSREEKILDSAVVSHSLQTMNYVLPDDLVTGETFARVRVSSAGNLDPTGSAADGEVEDYRINIVSAPIVESIVLNDGESQRSTIDRVKVTFDRIVDIDSAGGDPFQFINSDTGEVAGDIPVVSLQDGKTVVDFTFAVGPTVTAGGSLADGDYRLTINGSLVSYFGVNLDGNGDGSAGDNHVFGEHPADTFFRKFGDNNGNDVVDLFDFSAFRRAYGTAVGEADFAGQFDSNENGIIDLFDFSAFRRNYRA